MAYWLELRCESRSEDYADGSYDDACWSHSNDGCGLLIGDRASDLMAARSDLEANAKAAGWVKKRTGDLPGWHCPHCSKHLK